ncbi:hypothetical protein [Streptomyces sp. NPDC052494]|uniref:hypothetical protein n=1 Tax=Streptomyces sp. NPDC052494 TaxID=3365692 RepID=UPI0037D15AA0
MIDMLAKPPGTVRIRPVSMSVRAAGGTYGPIRLSLNGAGVDGTLTFDLMVGLRNADLHKTEVQNVTFGVEARTGSKVGAATVGFAFRIELCSS